MWIISTSTGFWLCVLGCWLVLLKSLSIVGTIRKRKNKLEALRQGEVITDEPEATESIESMVLKRMAKLRAEGIQHQANKAVMLLCCFGISFGSGVQYALSSPRIVGLESVFILSKHNDVEFSARVKGDRNELRFCAQPPVDFQPGEMFEFIDFVQLRGCKRVVKFKAVTDPISGDRVKFPIEEMANGG